MKKNELILNGSVILSRDELRLIKGGFTDGDDDEESDDDVDSDRPKCAKKNKACGTKISCCAGNYCVGNICWPSNP